MIDPLWLKALIKVLVLPPTGLLLISVLGLALWTRSPRVGRSLAATGVLALLVLSVPVVADYLNEFVDTTAPSNNRRNDRNGDLCLLKDYDK